MDDFEDPAVRRLRGVPARQIGDDDLPPMLFWAQAMDRAKQCTPDTLGVFLTWLSSASRFYPADVAPFLAVGMRAAMTALALTRTEGAAGYDQAQALAILHVEQWIGWPVNRPQL